MIRVRGARFSYDPGELPDVLHGIDLDIAPGEFVGLVGRNGSGKSSLARLLNGLHVPHAGTVTVDGHSTADPTGLVAVRAVLQMVFQNPENQQVGLTAFEDIAFGLANHGYPGPEMPGRARTALDRAGLDIALDRDVTTLSGGQLQKLALASVLALEPRHLVLDEATSMLDPGSRRRFLEVLARLRAEGGTTVVSITHHLEEVLDADRLVVLHEGRVRAEGTPAGILAQPDLLAECGLEVPGAAYPPAARAVPGTTVLALDDVSVNYGPRRRPLSSDALSGVTAAIGSGELVAVAGRSGAGKSTLVTVLKGLRRPSGGTIEVSGTDPWSTRRPELFDGIGYVFQYPEHQLFASTVRRDVAYGLVAQRLPQEESDARVAAALRRVGLDPVVFAERSPFGLSGGEKRRVALAGVLVTEPRVLLVDEPTAGLDLPSREAFFAILDDLRAQGVTIVWVTHRLEEIARHATRLLVIDGGRLVADGDPAALLSDETLAAALGWTEVAAR